MIVKQVLRDRRVVLSTSLEPTPYLEEIMHKANFDYKNDHNIIHTNSPAEALVYLDELMKK